MMLRLALRCAIIKLCFKMACSLGRVQIQLTLLSLAVPLPGGKRKSLYRVIC